MARTKIAKADFRPQKLTLKLADRVSLEFRHIRPGSFFMGSRGEYADEEPRHLVELSPFYLGIYPVTQEQFAVWTTSETIEHDNHFAGKSRHPAENMDWFQSSQFCDWLNIAHGHEIPTGFQAGLPSEAQWEYGCRGGTETEYYAGDGEAALTEAGWYDGNARQTTHPVGLLKPNDFGLFDMHGNVWEWCRDAYDADAYKKRIDGVCDPVVTPEGIGGDVNADRVFRGGSWFLSAGFCRAAFRYWWWPVYRNWSQGFRVCLFSGPVPQSGQPSLKQPGVESEPVSGDGAQASSRSGIGRRGRRRSG